MNELSNPPLTPHELPAWPSAGALARNSKPGGAHAKGKKEKFSDVFVNPNGRVAVVVDEAVLAHASGWYQASGSRDAVACAESSGA